MKQPPDKKAPDLVNVDFARLGLRIQSGRAAQKLSLREVAKRANVSYSTVQRMENGHSSVQLDMMISVMNVLKIDLRDFISGAADNATQESNEQLVSRLAAEERIPGVLAEIGKLWQESHKKKS